MTELRAYRAGDLPLLAEAWNNCFAGQPNFIAVTEADLRARAFEQPSFDPLGVVVAGEGGRALGFVHFGPRSNLWTQPSERRENRAEGQIYLVVAPAGERGLIGELLDAAEARLAAAGARRLLLGPSWIYGAQPYYNGIAGAYEMPGASPRRADLLAAACERGFAPVAEYGTPELPVERVRGMRQAADVLWSRAREWGLRKWARPVTSSFFPPRVSVALLRGREIVAMTAYGLWEEYARQYGRRVYGLTSVQVTTQWRGKGLGKLVMIEAMASAAEQGADGFHLHVWRANRPAWNLYHRALGFEPTHDWVTLGKPKA